MKVIVFGLSGQVGSILKKNKPHNIDFISPKEKSIEMINNGKLFNFLLETNPDVVLNLAAYTDVDGCEYNKDKAYLLNSFLPKEISKICSQIGSLLVHLSTDYVYNENGKEFINENSIIEPKSIYGKSKYLGEKFIVKNCSKYLILRSSWIYSDVGKNFYLTIKQLLSEKKNINVVNDQFGAPTLAYDLVDGILSIINFMENKKYENAAMDNFYGTYNISNQGQLSWYDFANTIAESLLYVPSEKIIPIKAKDFRAAAERPYNSRLDNTKLIKTFEIVMPYWKDSFEKFINNKFLT